MSDKRSNRGLGDQILKAVDDILESGNFDKLNSVVSDTVSKALEETRNQLEQVTGSQTKKTQPRGNGRSSGNQTKATQSQEYVKTTSNPVQVVPHKKNNGFSGNAAVQEYQQLPISKNKLQRVGSVSSVLYRVFGGIGTGIFGILFLIVCLSNIGEGRYWGGTALTGILLLASLSIIWKGTIQSARLKRAERYVQVMQGKAYMNLDDLALLTNKSTVYVRRDIKSMMQRGIFPQGHLDMQEQCLILGDIAYREYLHLEKSRKALQIEAEEQKHLQAEAARLADEAAQKEEAKRLAAERRDAGNLDKKEQAELKAMIQEGNNYIQKLRDLNEAIKGEVISAKLFQLENLLKEIFQQLKAHTEQMPEMHKFMEYYLPTTIKLVGAYEEFDKVSVPGEDILLAKTEIEKTLDTINAAFAELLNKLFRDRVFDVSTDAQVLQTMLAREGLTREPVFAKNSDDK